MDRKCSAVVLAGGRSARMGRPKATLTFGAETIVERIVGELARRFDEIVIVAAPAEAESLPASIREKALVIHDDTAYPGPLDALRRGLEAAAHEIAFACSCDLPMLDAGLAQALCGMLDGYDAAIPKVGGKLQPLCAAYHRRCAAALSALGSKGVMRVREIIGAVNARIVDEDELRRLDPEFRSFLNVNTPEEYQKALRLAGLDPKTASQRSRR